MKAYYDHYKEAKELTEELKKENLRQYADKIIGAIEEGSTGTEIFMALRWNIKNLLKDQKASISNANRAKANRLYIELDKAL